MRSKTKSRSRSSRAHGPAVESLHLPWQGPLPADSDAGTSVTRTRGQHCLRGTFGHLGFTMRDPLLQAALKTGTHCVCFK